LHVDEAFHVDINDGRPLSAIDVARATLQDPLLNKVLEFTYSGWPKGVDFDSNPGLTSFAKAQDSLYCERMPNVCKQSIVIPLKLQKDVLKILHEGHPGIVRSKLLARSLVWWPDLNKDIETACSQSSVCAQVNLRAAKDIVP